MTIFRLVIGTTDDFDSIEALLNESGNRSTYEVELNADGPNPKGFLSFRDFAQTILFGMAFSDGWCCEGVLTLVTEV